MRQTALQRRAPMKRRSRVRPSSQPKRNPDPGYPRHLRKFVKRLRDAWNASRETCVFCGTRNGERDDDGTIRRVANHHVLEKAWIKGVADAEGWSPERREAALWDLRNRLSVCEHRHLNHHAFVEGARIPRAIVLAHCPDVLELARTWGLEARFDRAYPEEATA